MILPDLQAIPDHRNLAIYRVGIKGYHHPITLELKGIPEQSTTGILELSASLAAQERGSHMSRFIESMGTEHFLVNEAQLLGLAQNLKSTLRAERSHIDIAFTLFLKKTAPASGSQSLMNYDLRLGLVLDTKPIYHLELRVPVATLCPCSKAMSTYNAHNQRCYITLDIQAEHFIEVKPLIEALEAQGSIPLYALLKRPDEKFVTDLAYETPRFVEDVVRDTAIRLDTMGFKSYRVFVENIESIHNHSAIAEIRHEHC